MENKSENDEFLAPNQKALVIDAADNFIANSLVFAGRLRTFGLGGATFLQQAASRIDDLVKLYKAVRDLTFEDLKRSRQIVTAKLGEWTRGERRMLELHLVEPERAEETKKLFVDVSRAGAVVVAVVRAAPGADPIDSATLDEVARRLDATHPDIIVICGDYVDVKLYEIHTKDTTLPIPHGDAANESRDGKAA